MQAYAHANNSSADAEMENEDAPDAEVGAQRVARDVHDHLPVNDYVSGLGDATSTRDGGHFHQPPLSLSLSIHLSIYLPAYKSAANWC